MKRRKSPVRPAEPISECTPEKQLEVVQYLLKEYKAMERRLVRLLKESDAKRLSPRRGHAKPVSKISPQHR